MPIAKLVSGRHHLQRARETTRDSASQNGRQAFQHRALAFPCDTHWKAVLSRWKLPQVDPLAQSIQNHFLRDL